MALQVIRFATVQGIRLSLSQSAGTNTLIILSCRKGVFSTDFGDNGGINFQITGVASCNDIAVAVAVCIASIRRSLRRHQV